MFQTTVAALTDKGRKRRNNEDWTVHFEPSSMDVRTQNGCLYIVADGVGGAAKGEQASQYAAQKLLYDYYHHTDLPPAERLSYAMRQAGNEIYKYAEEQGAGRMATTMVAAVILANKLIVANVGDSRAYLMRDGIAYQITHDHSIVGELVRAGQMTEEESLHSRVKNSLTRSLGGELDTRVDVFEVDLRTGDRVLLTTDGLLRYTLNQDVTDLLRNGTPEEAVQRMLTYALDQGGGDNITVLVVDIGQPLEAGAVLGPSGDAAAQPAEWELMATEADYTPPASASAKPESSRTSLKRRLRYRQYNLLYVLFGGAFLLLIVMVVMLINAFKPTSEPTPTPTAGTLSASTSPTTSTELDTATVTATTAAGDAIAYPPAVQPQVTTPSSSVIQAEPATQPPTPTPTPTSTPADQPEAQCMVKALDGDLLGGILGRFDISYTCTATQPECQQADCEPILACLTDFGQGEWEDWQPEICDTSICSVFIYYKSDDCKKRDEAGSERFDCSNPRKIRFNTLYYPNAVDYWKYPIVYEGTWIVIPISDLEVCTYEGGKIFYAIEED